MSTRSCIRIKRKDGTETGIYCHWDGYVDYVGVTLQLAYNTAEKVEELLKLGDLSHLDYKLAPENPEHDFEEPEAGVCIAYHRDRGEEFRQSNHNQEFNYIFSEWDNVWILETEDSTRNTKACNYLSLQGIFLNSQRLLLDAILELPDIESVWGDDEYAKAGHVKETCIKKAYEARASQVKAERESYNAYYNAYCN